MLSVLSEGRNLWPNLRHEKLMEQEKAVASMKRGQKLMEVLELASGTG